MRFNIQYEVCLDKNYWVFILNKENLTENKMVVHNTYKNGNNNHYVCST